VGKIHATALVAKNFVACT